MRATTRVLLAALLLGLGLAFGAGTALADGPGLGSAQTRIETLGPIQQTPGQHSITLSVRLTGADSRPVPGARVSFFVLTTVFGDRLMKLGDALTDTTGAASLVYTPGQVGVQTGVARFAGDDHYPAAQTTFKFDALGPVERHHNAEFGLETVRSGLPLAIGGLVLVFWGLLGFVALRTVRGIPAFAGASSPRVPARMPLPVPAPEHGRAFPARRMAAALALLLVVVAPVAWWQLNGGSGSSGGVSLSTGSTRWGTNDHAPGMEAAHESKRVQLPDKTFPATLVETTPAMALGPEGNLSAASANLPADVAMLDGKTFVLDTNRGRILGITGDNELSPVMEGEWTGEASLRGATAMTTHEGRLYVPTVGGENVLVIASYGRVEGAVQPVMPKSRKPVNISGIAVTRRGDLLLSDTANRRVLRFDRDGAFLDTIGDADSTAGEAGLLGPAGITLDDAGNLWVVDTVGQAVKQFSPEGDFLRSVGAGLLGEPRAVAVSRRGDIFVTDDSAMAVLAFAADGSYLGAVGAGGPAGSDPQLQAPHGLRVDADELYVMDRFAGLVVYRLP
jgi:DNA-binding beta-propeller fold protein YncE